MTDKFDPPSVVLHTCDPSPRKTDLAREIAFKSIDIADLRTLMLDDEIHLNDIRSKFWTAFNEFVREPPHMLIEFRGKPFDGIFAFLAQQCGGNPDEAGVVTLEASSTQVGHVRRILDYGSNDYFATRDSRW
jgi:hypothetical protein